ncbi:arylesterase [Agaricicola taiwanensis]|uniref:Arylesterase n=1 Tax=Agaricicola taiwanensis TaxID=591372 RepID=A0A8J3DUJ8_9RHOB|nr:arylesterase [Agaricicola taiwanensis]GGE42960.1 arylesterase [Agaricicola taiwanensis]
MIQRLFLPAIAIVTALLASSVVAHAQPVKIVALGDSLTAGYQLPPNQGFAPRLQAALQARGYEVVIENAGVSGDTASGGADRLDWAVGENVDGVIVELGANDALRGVDPDVTRKALDRILSRLKERNIPVLLAGMYAPRNMGPEYVQAFDRIYPELAVKYDVPLYPFFLDGVAGDRTLNLGDGVHPNEAGVGEIVERILPMVEDFVDELKGKG